MSNRAHAEAICVSQQSRRPPDYHPRKVRLPHARSCCTTDPVRKSAGTRTSTTSVAETSANHCCNTALRLSARIPSVTVTGSHLTTSRRSITSADVEQPVGHAKQVFALFPSKKKELQFHGGNHKLTGLRAASRGLDRNLLEWIVRTL